MSENLLKKILLIGGAFLIIYWTWRGMPSHANKRYFRLAFVGTIMAVAGGAAVSSLHGPLALFLDAVAIAGFVMILVFGQKYWNSTRKKDDQK